MGVTISKMCRQVKFDYTYVWHVLRMSIINSILSMGEAMGCTMRNNTHTIYSLGKGRVDVCN